MRRQICLEDIVTAALDSDRATRYHVMPGIVQAYHAGTASCPASVDVQPAIHDVRFDVTTGARVSEPWPMLSSVRILSFKVGPFVIAGPLKAGDKVVLLAFDLDPTAHQKSGNPSDPLDARRHAGGYWVAVPGDITDAGAFKDGAAIASGLVIGTDGGQDQIRFPGGGIIQLGATAGDWVALASKVSQAIADLATWVKTGVAPSGGGPVTYANPAPTDSVASSVIKAQ